MACVVGGVGVLNAVAGRDAPSDGGPGPAFVIPSRSASATSTPSTSASTVASAEETTSAPVAPVVSDPPTAAALVRTRVAVLNTTGRSGLASRVAARLGRLGWPVGTVANSKARPAASVVRFPERLRSTAELLRDDLGGSLVLEASATADGLVLLVAEDLADS